MVQPRPQRVTANDTDPGLQHSGSAWAYYPARPASFPDVQNDVHATLNNGDAVSYTFTGTGISYLSEKSDGYGLVDVYLDGQLQATVDANAAGVHNLGNQVLFSETGLTAGQHTLRLLKKSGV
jgi:alpha-galactosidase